MHIEQVHFVSPPTNLVDQSTDHFSFKNIPKRNPIKEAKQSLRNTRRNITSNMCMYVCNKPSTQIHRLMYRAEGGGKWGGGRVE